MYAALEEIEKNIAILIPDNKEKTIHIPLSNLPKHYAIGDVFKIEKKEGQWLVLGIDDAEKKKRLKQNKSKREQLLKRTKKRK